MEEVWNSACKKLQVPEVVAKCWFDKIKARMSTNSGRNLHNWCEVVEPKAQYLKNVNEFIVLAICFQYYEYDVKKNCVDENCMAFREFCKEAGYSDETNVKKVERLLGNESIEPYEGYEIDVQILQDLDLIVLGLPEDKYKNYTQLLRKEYNHLNDVSYKNMRLKHEGSKSIQSQNSQCEDTLPAQKHNDTIFERITQPFRQLCFPFTSKVDQLLQATRKEDLTQKGTFAFTSADHKRISKYNSNTYNPNKEKPEPGKRMVVLDGSNIAYAHACQQRFSVKGIKIALEYFEKMGHEVKAVVPQHRLRKDPSTDSQLLESLNRAGKIVLTPCKNMQGKSTVSYDDRFILQIAVEFDAVVISNDNFNDLIDESAAFKKVIETRVVGYTWCKDMFMVPKDPYGRVGPTLSKILNRS